MAYGSQGPRTTHVFDMERAATACHSPEAGQSSISCNLLMDHALSQVDAGGPGPRIESWAFAIDQEGLDLVTAAGVYHLRTCKLCDDGVVVMGEYGLSTVLLAKGFNLGTLMSRYRSGVDWRQVR